MNAEYVLLSAAEADLREIVRYTRDRWGPAQARTYVALLTRGIEAVVAGTGACKALDTLHPGLRTIRCEHHHVFCLTRDDGPALIVAIFHERMDLMVRLADRLG